jgi:secretion/DNA translocation related TadE-like protein
MRHERGSTAVLAVLLAATVLTVALVAVAGVRLADLRHRAGVAADLAALAGAQEAVHGGSPCPAAGRVARANGAVVVGCVTASAEVTVQVQVAGTILLPGGWLPLRVQRQARAGPSSSSDSSSTAPALSSGALPLPHAGLWTHDGQPWAQEQAATRSRVAASHSRAAAKPRAAKPAPPGWASCTTTVSRPVSG